MKCFGEKSLSSLMSKILHDVAAFAVILLQIINKSQQLFSKKNLLFRKNTILLYEKEQI